jgi:hypothetical protein
MAPRILVSLAVAAAFAWVMHRGGLPFAPPADTMRLLAWWGAPAFLALMTVSIYFRSRRWVHTLRPIAPGVSAQRAFAVSLLGAGTTFFAPLRLGEMLRPYLIADGEPDVTFGQGLGTVAAERALDGLAVVLMTTAALYASTPISPLPDHVGKLPIPISLVPATLRSASVLFTVVFAGLVALYFARDRVTLLVRRSIAPLAPKIGERAAQSLARVAEGMTFVSSPRSVGPLLRDTVLYWGTSAAAYWLLLTSVGLEPSFQQACVSLGIVGLGSMLPAGPGFFGAYQVASYTALAMYYTLDDVTTRGAMFVFVSYVLYLALNAGSCIVGLWLLRRVPRPAGSLASV